jgi:putative transposase
MNWVASVLGLLAAVFRSRADLQLENLALRHQLAVLRRGSKRPRLRPSDRIFWAWLSRSWSGWRDALVIVRPETVIAWRRRKFREYWTKLCRSGKPGRPKVAKEVRDLIRQMSVANPLWGSPHIVGELEKIGITLSRSTVAKYMVRHRKPPSQTWRSFLKNHVRDIVAVDFFIGKRPANPCGLGTRGRQWRAAAAQLCGGWFSFQMSGRSSSSFCTGCALIRAKTSRR